MIVFNTVALISVVFVAVRFFSFFPKAQLKNTGVPMPPEPGILASLYVAWFGLTLVFSLILLGVIF